jgi:hypothetical protein
MIGAVFGRAFVDADLHARHGTFADVENGEQKTDDDMEG